MKSYKEFINEAKIESKNIFDAVRNSDLNYIKNYKGDMNIKDNIGRTPLMMASIYNHLDIIKYLIEKGADINIKDNYGDTAYSYKEEYFNTYEFQKWYMDTIGNYEKLDKFVEGNIHPDIKKEYAEDAFKTDLGL